MGVSSFGPQQRVATTTATKQYNLEKLYHIKSCDAAISSLVFTSSTDTGVMEMAVGRDDGAISRYRFSDTTFPSEHSMVGPGVLMGAHPVSGLGVAYGGKVLLASSWSRSVVAVSREGRVKLQVGHDGWVTGVTVGRKGRETFAVTVGLDRVLQQWSLGHLQGKKTPTTQPTPTVHRIPDDKDGDNEGAWLLCLCLLDSTHVAIGDSGGRVWLWNLETKRVAISKKVHRCAINGVGGCQNIAGDWFEGQDDQDMACEPTKRQPRPSRPFPRPNPGDVTNSPHHGNEGGERGRGQLSS